MSNETRPVTGGTSGGLMRSLALCCCEVGKFSVRLMRDPGGVVSKLLSTPEVQACILLVGGYYITDSMQRRRCNRTSVGASSKHDCVEDVDDTDASVSSNVRRLNVSMNDNSISSGSNSSAVSGQRANPDLSLPPISTKDSDVLVIGVAGGSGSGKTTYSRAIFAAFGGEKMTYIMHDSYYKDRSHMSKKERESVNFDHPDALDTALMIEHIKKLKKREAVDIPTYDFANHVRSKTVQCAQPRTLILVEGILIFTDPALYELLDIKVFIRTDDDIRLIRRMKRDVEERDRTMQQVVDQYLSTVRPMHVKYVEPSMRNADIIVPESMNNVALDLLVHRLEAYISTPITDAK